MPIMTLGRAIAIGHILKQRHMLRNSSWTVLLRPSGQLILTKERNLLAHQRCKQGMSDEWKGRRQAFAVIGPVALADSYFRSPDENGVALTEFLRYPPARCDHGT